MGWPFGWEENRIIGPWVTRLWTGASVLAGVVFLILSLLFFSPLLSSALIWIPPFPLSSNLLSSPHLPSSAQPPLSPVLPSSCPVLSCPILSSPLSPLLFFHPLCFLPDSLPSTFLSYLFLPSCPPSILAPPPPLSSPFLPCYALSSTLLPSPILSTSLLPSPLLFSPFLSSQLPSSPSPASHFPISPLHPGLVSGPPVARWNQICQHLASVDRASRPSSILAIGVPEPPPHTHTHPLFNPVTWGPKANILKIYIFPLICLLNPWQDEKPFRMYASPFPAK